MTKADKDLVWLQGEIKSPPFSKDARIELRIQDREVTWRIFHHIDADAIVLLAITDKKTRETPKRVLDTCRARLAQYMAAE